MHGGDLVAEALKAQGVEFVFTLIGGHVSPILVGAKKRGIRVVDTRHEVTTVFAADAVARLTGRAGVAVVTAGPGVTNTITAVKNAQLAQSPLVLFGGAAATVLKGRGALQDIDQMALFKPHVKWATSVSRVRDLVPAVEKAFQVAQSDVPGPVFVETPIDILYDESVVREMFLAKTSGKSAADKLLTMYLKRHLDKVFGGKEDVRASRPPKLTVSVPDEAKVMRAAEHIRKAEKPIMLVGSQALLEAREVDELAEAITSLKIPVYLSGMARGLLGHSHPLQMRHKRRMALKDADLVLLAGVPCDFRLDYGGHIRRSSYYINVNRSRTDMNKNRRPSLGVHADPGRFLRWLSRELEGEPNRWENWRMALRDRDATREAQIDEQAAETPDPPELLNPASVCQHLEEHLPDDSILVADGGDFVATASYITKPRGPLSWLDPGVFGTLGVGAGFALGAKLVRPEAETWIIYGDGSLGYSLSEFDTFVRHNLPVIALVGNDACWRQIERDQVHLLGDDVGCNLEYTDYHRVVEGFGAKGFLLKERGSEADIIRDAQKAAASGQPVLINALIGKTDFRKGSISV